MRLAYFVSAACDREKEVGKKLCHLWHLSLEMPSSLRGSTFVRMANSDYVGPEPHSDITEIQAMLSEFVLMNHPTTFRLQICLKDFGDISQAGPRVHSRKL